MFCGVCGKQLDDDAKFCDGCGAKIVPKGVVQGQRPPVNQGVPYQSQGAPYQNQRPPYQNQRTLYSNQVPRNQGGGSEGSPIVKIILIVLAVVALGAGTFFAVLHFSGGEMPGGFFGKKETIEETKKSDKKKNSDRADEEAEQETEEEEESAEKEEVFAREATTAPAVTTAAPTTAAPTTAAPERPHRYEIVQMDCTWDQAYQDAKNRGGYLVNINSLEEYDYILNSLLASDYSKKLKLWIGGTRTANSLDYHWIHADGSFGSELVNGPVYASAWMNNEPSFRDASINQDEYYMNMFFYKKENRWVFNDVPNDIIAAVSSYKGTVGYICEYDQ